MKNAIKKITGTVCFVLILVLMLNAMTFVTRNKNEANLIYPYYYEKNNSLDVVFVGSSHVMCGVYPMELYRRYGIASYDFTSSALVLPQAYYQVVEALKTQTPKVLVINVSGVAYENTKIGTKEYVHVQLDNMKWSLNKINAINDLIENPSDRLEYYLPIVKFHTRWKSLDRRDFRKITGVTKGSYVSDAVMADACPAEIIPENETAPMSEYAERYLRKILDYCKDREINVLLLNTPTASSAAVQKMYNAVRPIAEEYGVPYLNLMHSIRDMGFDFSSDMRDGAHCNRFGAIKISDYVGRYLINNYSLDDRREDPEYKDEWDRAYRDYKERYPY